MTAGDIAVQRSPGGSMDPNSTSASINQTREETKQNTLFQMMGGTAQKTIKEKRMDFELNQQTATQNANKNKGLNREVEEVQQMVTGPIQCSMEDLADRTKSFDMFRKSYRKNEAMEDNRNLLKEKYARGKQLGQLVNQSRTMIKKYTGDIEQIRKQNAMRGLVDENGEIMKTPEEEQIQGKITGLKKDYQGQYNELKDLKSEIERI